MTTEPNFQEETTATPLSTSIGCLSIILICLFVSFITYWVITSLDKSLNPKALSTDQTQIRAAEKPDSETGKIQESSEKQATTYPNIRDLAREMNAQEKAKEQQLKQQGRSDSSKTPTNANSSNNTRQPDHRPKTDNEVNDDNTYILSAGTYISGSDVNSGVYRLEVIEGAGSIYVQNFNNGGAVNAIVGSAALNKEIEQFNLGVSDEQSDSLLPYYEETIDNMLLSNEGEITIKSFTETFTVQLIPAQ